MTLKPDAQQASEHRAHVYHYDHLGSIQALTDYGEGDVSIFAWDRTGGRLSLYSYDPWGQRRDPADWSGWSPTDTYTHAGPNDYTPRGFTDHEMLDDLGLVHMNGRIYDPMLGRFLSADTYVDGPMNLQGYNRFSYVHNNPLRYTDRLGYYRYSMKEPRERRAHPGYGPVQFHGQFKPGPVSATPAGRRLEENGVVAYHLEVVLSHENPVIEVPGRDNPKIREHEQKHVEITKTAFESIAPDVAGFESVKFEKIDDAKTAAASPETRAVLEAAAILGTAVSTFENLSFDLNDDGNDSVTQKQVDSASKDVDVARNKLNEAIQEFRRIYEPEDD